MQKRVNVFRDVTQCAAKKLPMDKKIRRKQKYSIQKIEINIFKIRLYG